MAPTTKVRRGPSPTERALRRAVRLDACPIAAAALADLAEERGEPSQRWRRFALWAPAFVRALSAPTRSNGKAHWRDEPLPGGYRVRVYHCPKILFVCVSSVELETYAGPGPYAHDFADSIGYNANFLRARAYDPDYLSRRLLSAIDVIIAREQQRAQQEASKAAALAMLSLVM